MARWVMCESQGMGSTWEFGAEVTMSKGHIGVCVNPAGCSQMQTHPSAVTV